MPNCDFYALGDDCVAVLDFVFDRYQADAETSGESFLQWVTSQRYDPARIEIDFKDRRRRAA